METHKISFKRAPEPTVVLNRERISPIFVDNLAGPLDTHQPYSIQDLDELVFAP